LVVAWRFAPSIKRAVLSGDADIDPAQNEWKAHPRHEFKFDCLK
jgi:hypothetical protein